MTIEQRQHDAEAWANAYADWLAADEQAHHYDTLRTNAWARLDSARQALSLSADVSAQVPTRVFLMPTVTPRRELVKVTYNDYHEAYPSIESLWTEHSE